MNLANKLTVFRMILVPIMMVIPFLGIQGEIYGISWESIVIALIFILACLTDKLDGYIARSRNQITTFGKFLDPIADKILVIVAMIMLVGMNNKIPFWIPAIVIIREFVVSGYRLVAVQKEGNVIAASIWGKIKTATQMFGVILAFLDINSYGAVFTQNLTGFEDIYNLIATILLTVSVIATIFSGIEYLKGSKELFKGDL